MFTEHSLEMQKIKQFLDEADAGEWGRPGAYNLLTELVAFSVVKA